MFTSAFCSKAMAIFDRFDHHLKKKALHARLCRFSAKFQREKTLHTLDYKSFRYRFAIAKISRFVAFSNHCSPGASWPGRQGAWPTLPLNCHFVSVGPKLSRSIETRPSDNCLQHITPVNEEMLFKPVDNKYVLNAINQLKNGKASGPDKITVTLVKDASEFIAHPLMLIFTHHLRMVFSLIFGN